MAPFANILNAILLFNNKMSKLLHMYVPIPEQFERTVIRRYVVVLKRRPAKTIDIRTPKRNQRRSASESNHPPIHLPHVRGSRDGLAQGPGDGATKPFDTNELYTAARKGKPKSFDSYILLDLETQVESFDRQYLSTSLNRCNTTH